MDTLSKEKDSGATPILSKEALCQECGTGLDANCNKIYGMWLCDSCENSQVTKAVVVAYTNYKGTTAVRSIIPKTIYFGSNEWHKEPQWLLTAFDLDKNADRHFAMADIHSWQ